MVFNCNEQLGGASQIDFFLLEETSNWPRVLTDTNSSQIVFTPEVNNVEAVLDPDGVKPSIKQKRGKYGSVWDVNITMSFITRSEALDQLLDQYQNKSGIIKMKLNSGFQKIVGTNEEPLILSYNVNEGEAIDDEKASTIVTIKGKTRQRPVFYTVT